MTETCMLHFDEQRDQSIVQRQQPKRTRIQCTTQPATTIPRRDAPLSSWALMIQHRAAHGLRALQVSGGGEPGKRVRVKINITTTMLSAVKNLLEKIPCLIQFFFEDE
jgi:hypothetical protein